MEIVKSIHILQAQRNLWLLNLINFVVSRFEINDIDIRKTKCIFQRLRKNNFEHRIELTFDIILDDN